MPSQEGRGQGGRDGRAVILSQGEPPPRGLEWQGPRVSGAPGRGGGPWPSRLRFRPREPAGGLPASGPVGQSTRVLRGPQFVLVLFQQPQGTSILPVPGWRRSGASRSRNPRGRAAIPPSAPPPTGTGSRGQGGKAARGHSSRQGPLGSGLLLGPSCLAPVGLFIFLRLILQLLPQSFEYIHVLTIMSLIT